VQFVRLRLRPHLVDAQGGEGRNRSDTRTKAKTSQFMDELRDKIRVKQYSYKTEKGDLNWTERFIRFH
jgi:hypothetical protein